MDLETGGSFQAVQELLLISNDEPRLYSYQVLRDASDSFSWNCIIGQGGSAEVYEATLPDYKLPIAIKKLQPNKPGKQFKSEFEILSKLKHPNLVMLLGHCCEGHNRLLVLELVPNDSLEAHLHVNPDLDWLKRMSIALGSARGIAYLHGADPPVIHRDIKPDNILLDNDFVPKMADFGLSRLMSPNKTHISSESYGTSGYVAPESKSPNRPSFTDKSDVFAFGVLLLELITGERASFYRATGGRVTLSVEVVKNLKKALERNDYEELVDVKLKGEYNNEEMDRMSYCAAAAVYKPKDKRPTMQKIVEVLGGETEKEEIWQHQDDVVHLRNPYYDNIVRDYLE